MPKRLPVYQAFRVDRLLEVCPELVELAEAWSFEECLESGIQREYVEEEDRRGDYDLDRTHFFIREFEAGKRVPYIVMDSIVSSWTPTIIDGRHRAVAAVHAGVPRINVAFSGLVSVANYCTGKRKTNPLC